MTHVLRKHATQRLAEFGTMGVPDDPEVEIAYLEVNWELRTAVCTKNTMNSRGRDEFHER